MTTTHYGQLLPEGRWTDNSEALIQHFLANHTMPARDARILTSDLYALYAEWCTQSRVEPASRQLFGRQVRAAGIGTGRSHGQRYYLNVKHYRVPIRQEPGDRSVTGVTEGDR